MVHSANTLQNVFFTKRKLAPTKPIGEKLLWKYTRLDKTEVPFNTKSKSQFARALCFSPFSCPFSVSIHFLEAYYMSDIVLATVLGNICSLSRVRLCDPMDCSSPGSSVHGIFQARRLKCDVLSPPGDLSDPGLNPGLLHLLHWQMDSLTCTTWEACPREYRWKQSSLTLWIYILQAQTENKQADKYISKLISDVISAMKKQ